MSSLTIEVPITCICGYDAVAKYICDQLVIIPCGRCIEMAYAEGYESATFAILGEERDV